MHRTCIFRSIMYTSVRSSYSRIGVAATSKATDKQHTILENRVPKGFFSGEPVLVPGITLFGSSKNPFGFHIEPPIERALHGTQKGSTWNKKVFFKLFSYGDSRRTPLGST